MRKECVPAGQDKGKGQGMSRGKGEGPIGVPLEGDNVMDKYQVIDLIDNIINEMGDGEPNDLKNEPSQNPEEELDRVEDDLGGAEGEELEDYEEGDEREGDAEAEDIGELANVMVDSILLDQDSAYQTYFRTVMKKHNIKGIRGLSSEKRSQFFKDVSSGWKKHKKVGESAEAVDEKKFLKKWGSQELPERWTEPKYGEAPVNRAQARKADAIRKGVKNKDNYRSEQELYEEFKQFFNYLTEQSNIDDLSILEDEELVEFYALVHEAYEIGTGLTELMQRPGAPIANPMNTYDNTIDKMKNQLRPERREKQLAAAKAATSRMRQ